MGEVDERGVGKMETGVLWTFSQRRDHAGGGGKLLLGSASAAGRSLALESRLGLRKPSVVGRPLRGGESRADGRLMLPSQRATRAETQVSCIVAPRSCADFLPVRPHQRIDCEPLKRRDRHTRSEGD